jgi:hypothetical protein
MKSITDESSVINARHKVGSRDTPQRMVAEEYGAMVE